jgi:hypothetical protein
MARRKSARRAVSKAFTMPWSEASPALFRLGEGWTPPETIQCRRTVKGCTVIAIFLDAEGRAVRMTTRLAWVKGEKALTIIDESMSIRFGMTRGVAP